VDNADLHRFFCVIANGYDLQSRSVKWQPNVIARHEAIQYTAFFSGLLRKLAMTKTGLVISRVNPRNDVRA